MSAANLRARSIFIRDETPAHAVSCDLCLEPSTDAAEFNTASGFRAIMCLVCFTEVVRIITPHQGKAP